jgi:hypothetical protein
LVYLKSGASIPIGGGVLEEATNTGWTIQLGLRAPIGRTDRPLSFFGEFGGDYTANDGNRQPVITSGAFMGGLPIPDDHVHPLQDFFETRFVELRRGGIHTALGANYFPTIWNTQLSRSVALTGRLGLRAGSVSTSFHHTATPSLQDLMVTHGPLPEGHGHDPRFFSFFSDVKKAELYFGLFGSVGMNVTYYSVNVAGFYLGQVTLGAEVEFGHDWFGLGDFDRGDHGLATVTPMLSVGFSF